MTSLRDKAYDYIRDKIITCEYMPGTTLDEKKLMEETGCGRTPVREALTVLSSNGLVNILPRRGMFVSSVSIKDIHDIYELKQEIEPMIIRSYGSHVSREKLQEFQTFFSSELDYFHYSVEDAAFHATLTDASDNRYYTQILNVVSDQSQRIRMLTNIDPERLKESNREHLTVIDAMLQRDWNRAADAMVEHYKKSLDNIMRFDFASEYITR